ncbi:ABC transporter substrate-binding protein, partial [Burkholderia pseudomallei]
MMHHTYNTPRRAVALLSLAAFCATACAAELTVVNFGGANGDAQKAAFN